MTDYFFLLAEHLVKILLQNIDQLVLVNGNCVRTAIRTFSVMPGTHPTNISIFIGTHCSAERPTTFLTAD